MIFWCFLWKINLPESTSADIEWSGILVCYQKFMWWVSVKRVDDFSKHFRSHVLVLYVIMDIKKQVLDGKILFNVTVWKSHWTTSCGYVWQSFISFFSIIHLLTIKQQTTLLLTNCRNYPLQQGTFYSFESWLIFVLLCVQHARVFSSFSFMENFLHANISNIFWGIYFVIKHTKKMFDRQF